MSAHLNEELSAYLDGELHGDALRAVESHLAECAECRSTLEGLRGLVRRAQALDDRPPERDLWAGIASRIGEVAATDVVPLAPRRRRFSFSV
ncbi:MAG: zf-HC2 domain-containing protein, partial [Gemmatimonadetes bacterium]|nr:zf-HC2 domain-containing protein [Gemmatimonadota bacterium]